MRSLSNTWNTLSARRAARRAARPRLGRWQRVALVVGALVLLLLLLGTAAVFYLAGTERGRRSVADRLEDAISHEIPGSMRIGTLERIGTRELIVRDLRFLKTDGEPVLTVERVQIDADVQALLRGEIAFERARVQGGHLIIAIEPSGRTGLEEAFSEAGPSASGDKDGGAEIQLNAIHVQDLTLTVKPSQDDLFRMRGVQGFVVVSQHGPPGVRVRLDRISGKLEKPEFLGAHADVLRADGLILGGVEHVLDIKFRAALEDDRFDAHLRYYNRDKPPTVELEFDPKEGVRTHLLALAAKARTAFSDAVDVHIK